MPKDYAVFLLFRNTNCLLRGHDQPVDFAEELIVTEIKLHGTQDTMEVLAALEHGAIYARVKINALRNTSSYFNLLFLCIPELWPLANWSAVRNFKYSINFKLLWTLQAQKPKALLKFCSAAITLNHSKNAGSKSIFCVYFFLLLYFPLHCSKHSRDIKILQPTRKKHIILRTSLHPNC